MACPECKSERCGTMNETHSEADAWHQEALCQGRQVTAAIAERDAYREALAKLVEQVGKTVGLPPLSSQCPPDHAYSDFAQAINAAIALLKGPA